MRTEKPLPNKHQLKSEATRRDLIEAAEKIFMRDGYAGAQIEAIAQEIGRTKGAVYAQFRNKEDLFLALLESHIRRRMDAVHSAARGVTFQDHLRGIREQFLDFAATDDWTLLLLEFKLYAYRNSMTSARIGELYETVFRELQQARSKAQGELSEEEQKAFRQAIAFTRAVPGAIALERYFEPTLNDKDATGKLMQTVFDAIRLPMERTVRTRPRAPRS